jgi:hypothetical protein
MWYFKKRLKKPSFELCKKWNALMWRLSLHPSFLFIFILKNSMTLKNSRKNTLFYSIKTYLTTHLLFSFSQLYQLHKTKITRFTRTTDEKKTITTIKQHQIQSKNVFDGTKQQQNQNCNIIVQKKFKKIKSSSFRYWTDKANEFSEFIPYQCYKIVHFELDFLFYLSFSHFYSSWKSLLALNSFFFKTHNSGQKNTRCAIYIYQRDVWWQVNN